MIFSGDFFLFLRVFLPIKRLVEFVVVIVNYGSYERISALLKIIFLNFALVLLLTSELFGFTFSPCEILLLKNFPPKQQELGFTCGPACLDRALFYWTGYSPGELAFAQALGVLPTQGAKLLTMVEIAHSYGLYSDYRSNLNLVDLKNAVVQGQSVIVEWWSVDAGHYSVVLAIDTHHVYMMDPWLRTNPTPYPIKYFLNNWFRTAIRISKFPLL